jgi:hypothetical protein
VNVSAQDRQHDFPWVALPLVFATVLIASMWLRYGGQWAENDTVVLTEAARAVMNEGTITPRTSAYDHGFAYPTTVAMLAEVTGLPIAALQTTLLPWLTVATGLMAFVAFRTTMGSGRAGALSAMLLLVQPDFLFVNQRGSHEKVTWTLVLAIVYALMASLGGRKFGQVAPNIVVFYLCGFALICTNAFFGSSFTTVILLALLGSLILARRVFRVHASRIVLPRLGYIFLVLGSLVYLVIFYLYAPASSEIGTLARVADRLAALYLDVQVNIESNVTSSTGVRSSAVVAQSATAASPYAAVSLGWRSPAVFFGLTAFTWLLMAASGFAWLVLAFRFLRRGVPRHEVPLFLVWIFAAAAACQIALSVASDFAGVLGGNLQLRLFPVFTLFAVPLLVATVSRYRRPPRVGKARWVFLGAGLIGAAGLAATHPLLLAVALPPILLLLYVYSNWGQSAFARGLGVALGVVACAYFAVAAVVKATNDPVVSNKWLFYSEAEARAIRWGNSSLPEVFVWSEFDERLQMASGMLEGDRPDRTTAFWVTGQGLGSVRYTMLSDVTAERAVRIGGNLPFTGKDDRIYDDGGASIYHRVPDTPYQP